MKLSKFGMCVIAAAVTAVSMGTAHAADLAAARVNVPFSFRAGSVVLPAGDYSVIRENGMGLVRIEGWRGSAMFIAEPSNSSFATVPELMFRHTAAGNVLTEVRSSSGSFRLVQLAH